MSGVAHGSQNSCYGRTRPTADAATRETAFGFASIVLQMSKVAGLEILRENAKQRAVTDSYDLNRATEVACGRESCTRKSRPRPTELWFIGEKRLLQHNRLNSGRRIA